MTVATTAVTLTEFAIPDKAMRDSNGQKLGVPIVRFSWSLGPWLQLLTAPHVGPWSTHTDRYTRESPRQGRPYSGVGL